MIGALTAVELSCNCPRKAERAQARRWRGGLEPPTSKVSDGSSQLESDRRVCHVLAGQCGRCIVTRDGLRLSETLRDGFVGSIVGFLRPETPSRRAASRHSDIVSASGSQPGRLADADRCTPQQTIVAWPRIKSTPRAAARAGAGAVAACARRR